MTRAGPAARAWAGLRRLLRARRGSAAVEFAFVAPVLIVLMVGLLELGRMAWVMHNLNQAVHEAARYAMVYYEAPHAQIEAEMRSRLGNVDDGPLTLILQSEVVDEVPYLRINASYDFTFATRLLPIGPIQLTSTSRVPR